MKRFTQLILAITTMLAIAQLAASDSVYFPKKKFEPEQFPALKAQLEADLDSGGRLDSMRKRDREAVLEKLDRIERILTDKTSLSQVKEPDRIALFNYQEEINALLVGKSEDRESCVKLVKLGSHIRNVLCANVAERDTNRLATREKLRSLRSSARLDESQ